MDADFIPFFHEFLYPVTDDRSGGENDILNTRLSFEQVSSMVRKNV